MGWRRRSDERTATAFWWTGRPNYGDTLTPLLLSRFSEIEVTWTPIADAELICVGSILDQVPPGWRGTIVGAGKLKESTVLDLSAARVLALRGTLSAEGVRGDYALGDPGLLSSELLRSGGNLYDLTVVPHWSDRDIVDRLGLAKWHPHVVDPSADSLTVIAEIAASKKIVSSSLHGVIIADAFRIPRRAELFPNVHHPYEGGEFKYHDYASALGEAIHFGELHTPNQRRIDRCQAELFDVFRSLARHSDKDDDDESHDRDRDHDGDHRGAADDR